MTEREELLAQRAVACKGWRWMPGMLVCGFDVKIGGQKFMRIAEFTGMAIHEQLKSLADAVPSLSDAATIGCLLHLVREGWGDDGGYTKRVYRSGGYVEWICYAPSIRYPAKIAHGESEAECLVAALESMNDD